ncbi:hypothetical protein V495_02367 [Pseudogymnoascus sp. VKM F-4514 (FW-929)]|nr:hypothetical protein V490_07012 [Pseudogymnoascus sp. VKM F-3557]KFY46600.1 hypothetical protein V495_02367 [Pseudogymnoascus sp. VKM F-4514 (FW-929)]KFY61683.1 hypothetical protein V497_02787 [Pseudogymnoascus sp. VKM F-4516 (FW-969)]
MAEIHPQVPPELEPYLQPQDSDNRRVALMTCGISGSGKSTLSKSVVAKYPSFIRLSIDAYIYDKYGAYDRDYPKSKYSEYQDEANEALKVRLKEILQGGKNDVVVDLSFAFRASRDEYRAIVEAGGGRVVLVYLKTDVSELRRRIEGRAAAGLDADSAFKMTPEIFERVDKGKRTASFGLDAA